MEVTEEDIISFQLECHLYKSTFNLEAAEEILKSGHDVNRECFGGSILKMLLIYGRGENAVKALELIFKYGAGSDIKENEVKYMDSIIFYHSSRPQILEILLRKGLNPNTIIRGKLALDLMIVFEQWEQAKLLFESGADIELIIDEKIKKLFYENYNKKNFKLGWKDE